MFNGNYIITGKIVCQTGLHIGGSNNSIEIGGSDNVIIRDAITNLPYIPGSSLKGKLRNLLELNDNDILENVKNNNGEPSTKGLVAEVFGKASDKSEYNINNNQENNILELINDLQKQINELKENCSQTIDNKNENVNPENDVNTNKTSKPFVKLIVRDSYPTEETISKWNSNYNIVNGSELKYENKIDRITCESNPRNIERVPVESEFEFEIIFGIYDDNQEEDYAKEVYDLIKKGLKLLEDNYLGGSGSRGFGRIKIEDKLLTKRSREYYDGNCEEETDYEIGKNKKSGDN